jgi:chaperonin cofactor prefoldin
MFKKSKDTQIKELKAKIEQLEKRISNYESIISMLNSSYRHFQNIRKWVLERRAKERINE